MAAQPVSDELLAKAREWQQAADVAAPPWRDVYSKLAQEYKILAERRPDSMVASQA